MLKIAQTRNEEKIWLSSPHMGGTEINYILQAFEENWIAPLGPNVNGFEQDLKTYLNSPKDVAALSSGTAALHLALLNCGVTAGDEVICQSLTFTASANPIMYLGATPVFIDSEPETWNMCPKALQEAITDRLAQGKKVKAIIVVHLYGMPCKMDEILQIANQYHIPVIEDAAEALGSTYKGKNCGTLGTFGVLSFNGNKIITTSGGGALVCPCPETKDKTIFWATQARDQAPHYQHSEVGYNYRMSNITAGIGRGQMEVIAQRVEQRRKMNAFYQDVFAPYKGITIFTEEKEEYFSNHWLSVAIVNEEELGVSLEELYQAFADRNIEVRPVWKPMHLQPVYAAYPYYGAKVAETLFHKGICLPSGSNLSADQLQRIASVIEQTLEQQSNPESRKQG